MFEIMKQQLLPLLSMQDLTLRTAKQPCILSLSRGEPKVGGQESVKGLPEWGPQEALPPAYLTYSDGSAFHQEHVREVLGGWGRGSENRSILAGKWRETKALQCVNELESRLEQRPF